MKTPPYLQQCPFDNNYVLVRVHKDSLGEYYSEIENLKSKGIESHLDWNDGSIRITGIKPNI